MSLITPAYQSLQSEFHNLRPDYGMSGSKHVDPVLSLAKSMNTRDILDYGCGKATLQKGIPFPIQNYDPCMSEYNRRPKPARLVVCTDVMEHIEPECLKEVMDDLQSLTLGLLYVNVACREAKKILQDGRNAHILIQNPNWWLSWFLPRFELQAFQGTPGVQFTALFVPLSSFEKVESHDPATTPNLQGDLSANARLT